MTFNEFIKVRGFISEQDETRRRVMEKTPLGS